MRIRDRYRRGRSTKASTNSSFPPFRLLRVKHISEQILKHSSLYVLASDGEYVYRNETIGTAIFEIDQDRSPVGILYNTANMKVLMRDARPQIAPKTGLNGAFGINTGWKPAATGHPPQSCADLDCPLGRLQAKLLAHSATVLVNRGTADEGAKLTQTAIESLLCFRRGCTEVAVVPGTTRKKLSSLLDLSESKKKLVWRYRMWLEVLVTAKVEKWILSMDVSGPRLLTPEAWKRDIARPLIERTP